MDIDDGGPAFPEALAISPAGDVHSSVGGISKRELYALVALNGLLAGHLATSDMIDDEREVTVAGYASASFRFADAMLAASRPGTEGE